MKTYFYTLKEKNKAWDECDQESINCKSWELFAKFCNMLSKV
jgi:hypothetical protein